MEKINLDAARRAACAWLDEHKDGTLAQMADGVKHRYPDYPDEIAVVLWGTMAAELHFRTQRSTAAPIAGIPR
jgi:hypothetical protein